MKLHNLTKYVIISIIVITYMYYKSSNIQYNNEYYRIYILFLVGMIFFDYLPNITNHHKKEGMEPIETNNNINTDDNNDAANKNRSIDRKNNKKTNTNGGRHTADSKTSELIEKVIDNTDEDEINFDEETTNELSFDFKNLSKLMQYND